MGTTRSDRRVNADRRAVYRALLDAAAIQAWRVPEGMTSQVHEFEPHVGGRFRVSLTYDSPAAAGKSTAHTDTYHGHFAELVADERVVEVLEFETDDPALAGEMVVTTMLTDAEGGGTKVVMIHDGLPRGVSPSDNRTGTEMALAKLSALVEGTPR